MSENFAMSFSPLPFVVDDDSNVRWPQFPMNNELFDQLPPLKRPRISSESSHFDLSHQPNMNPRNMQNPQNHVSNNRGGTSHIFYKTRLCAKFRMGTCRNGESCNFAHGNEDVRQPPANWQELVGVRDEDKLSANWDDDQKIIHKMKLCKKYYNGEECPYGERCSFLHEDPSKFRDDAGRCRESSVISVVANGSPKSHMNGNNNAENIKSVNNGFDGFRTNGKSFWKTKLCTKWETTGLCPFGDKCHFAHGHAELQMPNGRTDSEAIGAAFSIPVNDASPITDVVMLDSNEDELKKKNLLKWKISKKVNRIYADWPDNLPSPRQLV